MKSAIRAMVEEAAAARITGLVMFMLESMQTARLAQSMMMLAA